MDAITFLTTDHQAITSMFTKFQTLTDEYAQAVAAEKICHRLSVHYTVEEEIFYPEARIVLDRIVGGMVDDFIAEHAQVKELIAAIKTMTTGEDLSTIMLELKEISDLHMEQEEVQMFPRLKEMGMEIIKLGREMSRRQIELLSTVK